MCRFTKNQQSFISFNNQAIVFVLHLNEWKSTRLVNHYSLVLLFTHISYKKRYPLCTMVNTHQLGVKMFWRIFLRTVKKTLKQGLTKRSRASSQYFFLCGFITLLGIQGRLLHSVLSLYNLTHSEPFSAFSFANYKSSDISLSFICASS